MNISQVTFGVLFLFAFQFTANASKCHFSTQGIFLIDHVMDSFPVHDLDSCHRKCAEKPGCKSINYYIRKSFCELNNDTVEDKPRKRVVNEDVVYFTIPDPKELPKSQKVPGNCSLPLGMESGAIPNDAITASSFWAEGHEPFRGRLHSKISGSSYGIWASKYNRAGEYLKVDLGETKSVSMVATQGRPIYRNFYQWVTSYTLGFSKDGNTFEKYKESVDDAVKVFKANTNSSSVVKHELQPAIQARYIRFVVKTWHNHICMRAEIYGCSI